MFASLFAALFALFLHLAPAPAASLPSGAPVASPVPGEARTPAPAGLTVASPPSPVIGPDGRATAVPTPPAPPPVGGPPAPPTDTERMCSDPVDCPPGA